MYCGTTVRSHLGTLQLSLRRYYGGKSAPWCTPTQWAGITCNFDHVGAL